MIKNSLLAIIPAAGIGQRFGSEIPKQYMSLDGKSVIERATEPFILSEYVSKIIIATSQNDSLIKEQSFYNNEKWINSVMISHRIGTSWWAGRGVLLLIWISCSSF